MKPFFSIAIPTYEMHGLGTEFLEFTFQSLRKQTFQDFEVIVSDHSSNDSIKTLCGDWEKVKYFKNENGVGKSSTNINYAIKQCSGEWIKILFQDDFLFNDSALEIMYNHILKNKESNWLISACEHSNDGINMYRPFYPKWNDRMHLGINTFSSPSVLTFKNNNVLLFDERLVWLMDVEYYKRMYDLYGEPSYLNEVTIVNRTWVNQVSNILNEKIKNYELDLVTKKYVN